ncbi:hypothetical protein ACP4J4_10505 [Aureimonas ureilytica]|uniref:hypothetical protein n=1 Tax=Aureimonas ureilytica TaxID=401562 RepID=UPI003CF8DB58
MKDEGAKPRPLGRGAVTSTLRTLLDRVEQGEGRDEELDVRLVAAFFAPATALVEASPFNGAWCIYDGTGRNGRPRLWECQPLGHQPSPTSSIDTAVYLVEKVLPGWDHGYESGDGIAFGKVWSQGRHDDTVVRGEARTPARAILAALLRAKIAQEGEQ